MKKKKKGEDEEEEEERGGGARLGRGGGRPAAAWPEAWVWSPVAPRPPGRISSPAARPAAACRVADRKQGERDSEREKKERDREERELREREGGFERVLERERFL